MLQKSFFEAISLEREGPKLSRTFKTSCKLGAEKSYITCVSLLPKVRPKCGHVTKSVSEEKSVLFNRKCSFSNGEKSFESAVSMDHNVVENSETDLYCLNIELEPQLEIDEYSETVHNFPKEKSHVYTSTIIYDPCYVKENYIVGLEIQKVREVDDSHDIELFVSQLHIPVAAVGVGNEWDNANGPNNSNFLNGME